jgi:hypothetical protein
MAKKLKKTHILQEKNKDLETSEKQLRELVREYCHEDDDEEEDELVDFFLTEY